MSLKVVKPWKDYDIFDGRYTFMPWFSAPHGYCIVWIPKGGPAHMAHWPPCRTAYDLKARIFPLSLKTKEDMDRLLRDEGWYLL